MPVSGKINGAPNLHLMDKGTDSAQRIIIYAPGIDRGGVATALRSMIQVLESAGHSVSVLVPYASNIDDAAIPKQYIVGYCRKRPIRFKIVQRIVNLFSILTAYRFYFIGVKKVPHDICIVYSAPNNAQWVRYTNKPIIGWFHGIAGATREKACVSWQESRRTRLMEVFYRKFKSLVAVTNEVAESYMQRYRIDKPNVVQNLLDIDGIVEKSVAPLEKPLLGDKKLLYCGRMSHDKGLDRLITALWRIKKIGLGGWHLTILGDGPERVFNERLVEELGLNRDITFIGMVDNPYPYMRAADLLVCPSRAEGLGLVLWEALICNTQVLATDSGGTRTALRDGEWGRLVANNEDALYSGLIDWMNGVNYEPRCGFASVKQAICSMNIETSKEMLSLLK